MEPTYRSNLLSQGNRPPPQRPPSMRGQSFPRNVPPNLVGGIMPPVSSTINKLAEMNLNASQQENIIHSSSGTLSNGFNENLSASSNPQQPFPNEIHGADAFQASQNRQNFPVSTGPSFPTEPSTIPQRNVMQNLTPAIHSQSLQYNSTSSSTHQGPITSTSQFMSSSLAQNSDHDIAPRTPANQLNAVHSDQLTTSSMPLNVSQNTNIPHKSSSMPQQPYLASSNMPRSELSLQNSSLVPPRVEMSQASAPIMPFQGSPITDPDMHQKLASSMMPKNLRTSTETNPLNPPKFQMHPHEGSSMVLPVGAPLMSSIPEMSPRVGSPMMAPRPGLSTQVGSPMMHPQSGMPPRAGSPMISSQVRSSMMPPGSNLPQGLSPMMPPRPGLPLDGSPMMPLRPGLPHGGSPIIPPGSGLPHGGSPMMPPGSGLPRGGSPMIPPGSGLPHGGSPMIPPGSGLPRGGSPMIPPGSGLPRGGSPMIPPESGLPYGGSPMIPPGSGLPHGGSAMIPTRPGMLQGGSPMMPPRTGMPQGGSPMIPPGPGMIPQGGSQMMPQRAGMPQEGSPMMPPRPGMPHGGSHMMSSGPGMPPQVGSPMMPPGSGGGMAPGPSMPPHSSSMGAMQAGIPPTAMGGMQNRYPGSGTAGGGYPQSQGRRLNPDDMPSPLQVMEEDRQAKSGEFLTVVKGTVPPLVTTDYFVRDGGISSPRFIRSTMYNVPVTPDMMKQASVPFGLVINPFAELEENEAPVYSGTSFANGPVRCNRCKAYMSPLMMFMNGGRRFQCLLCKQVNEVQPEYHCHMDSQGARADKFQRPELCLGSYEYAATAEYCKDKILPKEPAFIFVMEMSNVMMQRGIINLICDNMKSLLQNLPKEEGSEKSSIRVGFITYDSSVHFYKLSGVAPEMCVVCDKENIFVPVPDGVLCDVEEVADNIDRLMECIPQNFHSSRETSGTLYGAIQAGMSALKASGRSGKLFVFHSSLPVYEGPGKLKNREDRKVLGTDKENVILTSQNTQYNTLAQDLVGAGCGVDLFVFNESYIDLATIGQVSRLTGGQCYKYTYFQPNKDSHRFVQDLKNNLSRNIAFDAVMRVRTSTGVRPVEFYGHFFMSNTQDIELACVDSSKAVSVEIKHDDKLTDEDGVYIQVAILYTSIGGQRRLRVHNLALNVCTQMADLYKNCELDALMNFLGKQSMSKFLESSAKQVKENLIARTAQILACYRKNCATPSSAGQLILPELMKLLPLYMNCLTKCDALSGGQDLTCDDRSWHMYQFTTMPCEASYVYFYPRLLSLTELDPNSTDVPPSLRSSYDRLNAEGVFLLENGLFMFVWVGSGTPQKWMNDVFGVSAPHQLDPVLSELPVIENETSKRVRNVVELVRKQRKQHMRMFVVPQQGKHEVVMRNYLVEDKGVFGGPSYVDFLCHVHKEIRSLLS